MKTIKFTNPDPKIFFKLKSIGLVDFHTEQDPKPELLGKGMIGVEGISENPKWDSYKEGEIVGNYIIKQYHKGWYTLIDSNGNSKELNEKDVDLIIELNKNIKL